MKQLIYFMTAFMLLISGCKKEEPVSDGCIYGVVVDKSTGKTVSGVIVKLIVGDPTKVNNNAVEISSIVTGSEGQFEFDNLSYREYYLATFSTDFNASLYGCILSKEYPTCQIEIQLQLKNEILLN